MQRLAGRYISSDPTTTRESRHRTVSDHLDAHAATASGIATPLLIRGVFQSVPWVLKVVGEDIDVDTLQRLVKASLARTDALLNPNNPSSEMYRLNNANVGVPITISPDLEEAIALQRAVWAATDGLFDPATCPRWRSAKESVLGRATKPQIPEACTLSGSFRFEGLRVTRLHADAELDPGATIKGFAVDAVVRAATGGGYKNILFEYGATCKAAGLGYPWCAPVCLPDGTKLRAMPLGDGVAMSTTNDTAHTVYNTNVLPLLGPDGVLRTQRPDSVALVAVTCTSAAVASALTVTCMILNNVEKIMAHLDPFWVRSLTPVLDVVVYVASESRLCFLRETAFEAADAKRVSLAMCSHPKVAIVGGGVAGMCAALEAAACGAKVTLLECGASLGGVAPNAIAGITAVGTSAQRSVNVADCGAALALDSGGQAWTHDCDAAIQWMMSQLSSPPMDIVVASNGHSVPRVHSFAQAPFSKTFVPFGTRLVAGLASAIQKQPGITVVLGAKAVELVTEVMKEDIEDVTETFVAGVVYQVGQRTVEMHCDAVVLAAGGLQLPFVHPEWFVRTAPTESLGCGPGKGKTYFPAFILQAGAVLVDALGRRFVDELLPMGALLAAVKARQKEILCDRIFCVWNDAVIQNIHVPLERALPVRAVTSYAEFAKTMGVKVDNVTAFVEAYVAAGEAGVCPDSGKTVFPAYFSLQDSSFVITPIAVIPYGTSGGINTASSGEVVVPFGGPIGGLLAAGDAINVSRTLEGNPLLSCLVSGRSAGYRAATIKQRKREGLGGEWVGLVVSEVFDVKTHYVVSVRLSGAVQVSGLRVGDYVEVRRMILGQHVAAVCGIVTRPEDRGTMSVCLFKKDDVHCALVGSLRQGAAMDVRVVAGPLWVERARPGEVKLHGKVSIREVSFVVYGVHALGIALATMRSLMAPPYVRKVATVVVVDSEDDKATAEKLLNGIPLTLVMRMEGGGDPLEDGMLLGQMTASGDHVVWVGGDSQEEGRRVRETLLRQGHAAEMVYVLE